MTLRRAMCLVLCFLVGCGNPNWNSGDRVLVAKCLYEPHLIEPGRFDVVVFKYPSGPMKRNVPTNYIKRLLGLPGEIIAIFMGQLFKMTPQPGEDIPGLPGLDDKIGPLNLWQIHNQPSHLKSQEWRQKMETWFEDRRFEILRKPPEVMMAMRRLVNDNNYQAEDLKLLPARWQPKDGSSWSMAADRKSFTTKAGDGKNVDWLTYQHLVRPAGPIVGNLKIRPQLITDYMGYNGFNLHEAENTNGYLLTGRNLEFATNWAGDLMLEATVNVTQPSGEFLMELNRGVDRFQARWDLASGQCTLFRVNEVGESQELGSAATNLRGTGSHAIRFANFDARLTVWVDKELPFSEGVAYDPAELPSKAKDEKVSFRALKDRSGPRPNDIERPASLGFQGASITVTDVRLWRDTYYTMDVNQADVQRMEPDLLSDPSRWSKFQDLNPVGMHVYPGHYLCLGDNSTHSSDSRYWGLVPQRLMLGRALMVYFPLNRAGLIR